MFNDVLKLIEKPAFSGHETFPFRYGWITKILTYFNDNNSDNELSRDLTLKGDEREIMEAMKEFGVGKNMISSMKFWAEKSALLENIPKKGWALTSVGKTVAKYDPYLDYPESLWLIHWNLCSKVKQTTTFYYAFNHYNSLELTKDSIQKPLIQLSKDGEWKSASDKSIQRDVDVFFRTYVMSKSKNNVIAEDTFECPLTELGIIQESPTRLSYEFVINEKQTLSNYIFAYALDDFWNNNYGDQSTMSVDRISYDSGSPGKVFKIDEQSISLRLNNIEKITNGYFQWTETAGMYQLIRNESKKFDPVSFLDKAYNNIGHR